MMKTFSLYLCVAIVAAAAGFYWHGEQRSPEAIELPSSPLAFALPDLEGNVRHHNDWQGQVVMLNFWATWCPPCKEEIPDFVRIQEDLGERGVQVVGVALDQAPMVLEFINEIGGINYPQLIAEGGGYGLLERYGNDIGTLPYTVFINRDGDVVARHSKGILTYNEAREELEKILGSSNTPDKTSTTSSN